MERSLAAKRTHCLELIEELLGYLDDELSTARCRAIERHLADCACCEYLASRVKRTVGLCRAAGQARLPASVKRQARQRIHQLLDAEAGRPRRRRAAPPA
jgi:anti-sigma factor RsiW